MTARVPNMDRSITKQGLKCRSVHTDMCFTSFLCLYKMKPNVSNCFVMSVRDKIF